MSTSTVLSQTPKNLSEIQYFISSSQGYVKSVSQRNSSKEKSDKMPVYGGGSEKCPRCSKTVYLAEKKVGAGHSFHAQCFSCLTCNKKLDASILSEHKGEIYCKTCYTRQFGVHGLISGVTMTTENSGREIRHSRRSSYGSDLDSPLPNQQPTRPRANSNENTLRGEHGPMLHDELPKLFPWRNDVLPDKINSPTETKSHGIERLVEKPSQNRPVSQIGFERVVERNPSVDKTRDPRHSTLQEDDGREKYIIHGETLNYGNGTAAIINMPTFIPPQRVDSNIGQIDMPFLPTKSVERTSSSSEMYGRQTSREPQFDVLDRFTRLSSDDRSVENLSRQNSNSGIRTNITENPLIKPSTSHPSTYESNFFSVQQNDYSDNERTRSRDSSPSASTVHQRTSSSTSGYNTTSVHSDRISRSSTSPSAAFVGQHDYINMTPTVPKNDYVIHRPVSPHTSDRTPSALNEFVTKTNPVRDSTLSNNTGKYSTLSALVQPMRPLGLKEFEDD